MEWLVSLVPEEILIMLVAATPVIEIRGAIPFGQSFLGMTPWQAFFWGFVGNLIPVILLLLFLGPFSAFLSRHFILLQRFFDWLFLRTQKRSHIIRKYGPLGLILLVSIPLPITGGWTGAVAAFLLRIKFEWAFLSIAAGIFIAGMLVTIAVAGAINVLEAHFGCAAASGNISMPSK